MNLHVYQWEKYDRPYRWWIWVVIFLLVLMWLSVSRGDRWGIVLILLVVWWYTAYEYKTMHDMYLLTLDEEGLQIGSTRFYRHQLQWFSIWFVPDSEDVDTLYIYTTGDTLTYTPDDTQQEVADFVTRLSDQIPYIKQPQLSSAQRVMKLLRI